MIDRIIPLDIFQNVIFNFCNGKEQILLKKLFYNSRLEITILIGIICLTDDILKTYSKIKYLNASNNLDVTDEGIKHMDLKVLNIQGNYYITNKGIKHMTNLKVLDVSENIKITDEGIKHMTNLKELYANGFNSNITDEGIKHMDLEILYTCDNSNITNEDIKHMNLKCLCASESFNITKEGIKHMTNMIHCKLYQN